MIGKTSRTLQVRFDMIVVQLVTADSQCFCFLSCVCSQAYPTVLTMNSTVRLLLISMSCHNRRLLKRRLEKLLEGFCGFAIELVTTDSGSSHVICPKWMIPHPCERYDAEEAAKMMQAGGCGDHPISDEHRSISRVCLTELIGD